MSKMKMDRKPPLPKSPIRLRSRRVLRSNSAALQSVQTPPGSLTKSEKVSRMWDSDRSEVRPEYLSMSCEYRALVKMVSDEIVNVDAPGVGLTPGNCSANGISSLFERGRFYDQYSARRNERLRRKRGYGEETPSDSAKKSTVYDLGVTVGPTKRRANPKKLESLRKSVCSAYSAAGGKTETAIPRYSLRSSTKAGKENSKPPTGAAPTTAVKSRVGSEHRVTTRSVRNI